VKVPSVTTIIPCYQHGHLVDNAIDAILSQSVRDLEVIVVDDGSTDATEPTVSRFLGDSRVRYIQRPHLGLASARNHGMMLATGRYVQFLDADDVIYPDKLERQLSIMDDDSTIEMSHTDFCCKRELTGELSNKYASPVLSSEPFIDNLVLRWERGLSIPCHCFLFRRSVLRGFAFDTMMSNHEDWVFNCVLAAGGRESVYIPDELCEYRVFPKSMARDKAQMALGYAQALSRIETLSETCRELVAQRKRIDRGAVGEDIHSHSDEKCWAPY